MPAASPVVWYFLHSMRAEVQLHYRGGGWRGCTKLGFTGWYLHWPFGVGLGSCIAAAKMLQLYSTAGNFPGSKKVLLETKPARGVSISCVSASKRPRTCYGRPATKAKTCVNERAMTNPGPDLLQPLPNHGQDRREKPSNRHILANEISLGSLARLC